MTALKNYGLRYCLSLAASRAARIRLQARRAAQTWLDATPHGPSASRHIPAPLRQFTVRSGLEK